MKKKEVKDDVEDVQEAEELTDTEKANKVIKNHVYGSMGVGLIPIPIVDLVGLTGIQINMLRSLSKLYDVPFSQDKGKHILASLLGGGLPVSLTGAFLSLVKSIPIVGQAAGALTLPLFAGASTYAVGKVFVQHFASGGTFLNFNPDVVRDYYAEMFKEGKLFAAEMKK